MNKENNDETILNRTCWYFGFPVVFGLASLIVIVLVGTFISGIEYAFTDIEYNRFLHFLESGRNSLKLLYISLFLGVVETLLLWLKKER